MADHGQADGVLGWRADGAVERLAHASARHAAVMAAFDVGLGGRRLERERREATDGLRRALVECFGDEGARQCMPDVFADDGVPAAETRDPSNPCDAFVRGTPGALGACETDGHYACDECEERATCDGGCGRRPSQCECPERLRAAADTQAEDGTQ